MFHQEPRLVSIGRTRSSTQAMVYTSMSVRISFFIAMFSFLGLLCNPHWVSCKFPWAPPIAGHRTCTDHSFRSGPCGKMKNHFFLFSAFSCLIARALRIATSCSLARENSNETSIVSLVFFKLTNLQKVRFRELPKFRKTIHSVVSHRNHLLSWWWHWKKDTNGIYIPVSSFHFKILYMASCLT